MIVRAKFKCQEVTKRLAGYNGVGFVYAAKFNAVTSGSEDNQRFYAATPYGSLELQTMREDQFEPGKEYYLDFIPADAPADQASA